MLSLNKEHATLFSVRPTTEPGFSVCHTMCRQHYGGKVLFLQRDRSILKYGVYDFPNVANRSSDFSFMVVRRFISRYYKDLTSRLF